MKTKKLFAPAYNNKKQVIDCVATMLDIDPATCSCELQMVIGWNGEKYVTSTDWHITYPGGECILPPCVSPQYPMFIPQRCGILHTTDAIVESTKSSQMGYTHHVFGDIISVRAKFDDGQPLAITYSEDDEVIILSDCEVKVGECFGIVTDEDTVYAHFVKGKLALI